MLQARLTLSFHCFSVRLMYLDLQLAMLVSTDCSVAIASSWVESGLYHMVRRSISLVWRHRVNRNHLNHLINTDKMLLRFVLVVTKGNRQMKIPVTPVKESGVSCSTCEAENLCCFFWTILKENMNRWTFKTFFLWVWESLLYSTHLTSTNANVNLTRMLYLIFWIWWTSQKKAGRCWSILVWPAASGPQLHQDCFCSPSLWLQTGCSPTYLGGLEEKKCPYSIIFSLFTSNFEYI